MSNNGFFVELSSQSDAVTGSGILVNLKLPDGRSKKVLIDCGMFLEQSMKARNKGFKFDPKELDAVIVTHGHIDHMGRLPLLVKLGYQKRIYATNVTANILPTSLEDNYKIMTRDNSTPIYSMNHVEEVARKLVPKDFDEFFSVNENIDVAFIKNGHLFGAAMVYLKCSYHECEDIHILFTGDYKKDNVFFRTPKRLGFALTNKRISIVTETTYGDTFKGDIKPIFHKEIMRAISDRHSILLPSFSLGRSQEVLLRLRRMQAQGLIPQEYKIYYDGALAIKYLNLAEKDKLGIEKNSYFTPRGLHVIGADRNENKKQTRKDLLKSKRPFIMVSSSGNGSFGPSNYYLREMLSRENATIIFTGYCTEGTVGRRLIDCPDCGDVKAFGENFVKRARLISTAEFSAHAQADELLDFIDQFRDIGAIILTHGDYKQKLTFKALLNEELELNIEKLKRLGSKKLVRLDAWGLVSM